MTPSSPTLHSEAPELRICLLGAFRVELDGRDLGVFRRCRRLAALVSLLALAPGHALHREVVQDTLWPELDGDAGANNLHNALHHLRRAFEPGLQRGHTSAFVALEGNVLRLRSPGSLWIDVEAFDLACQSAQHGGNTDDYNRALQLYASDLVPEDPYADWLVAPREALRSTYLDLLAELASLYQASGELTLVARTLERLVSADPMHEDAMRQLIDVYTALGQRQRAVSRYRQLRRVLEQDFLHELPPPDGTSSFDAARLTRRERQIGDLAASGLSNRRIADALGMSPRTTEKHVSRILQKLQLYSRDQLSEVIRRNTMRA